MVLNPDDNNGGNFKDLAKLSKHHQSSTRHIFGLNELKPKSFDGFWAFASSLSRNYMCLVQNN